MQAFHGRGWVKKSVLDRQGQQANGTVIRQQVGCLLLFSDAPEITDYFQLHTLQNGMIIGGQAGKVIRAKDESPLYQAGISRDITAQVAEIDGAGKRHLSIVWNIRNSNS